MIIRNKDTEVLEIQILNDIIYVHRQDAIAGFRQYLHTKLAEFEKELTTMVYQGNNYVSEQPKIVLNP